MRDWRERRRYRRYYYQGPRSAVGGVVLLGLGILLLLDRMGILYFRDVFQFWPMVFVAAGLAHLTRTQTISGRLFSGVLIAAGVIVTAANLGYLYVRGDLFWPLVLIGMGILMLGRALETHHAPPDEIPTLPGDDAAPRIEDATTHDHIHASVVFSSAVRRVTAQNFPGAKLEAVFGAVELDLRQAGLPAEGAMVKADAVFGGIDILVPETWAVEVRGEGVFGSVSDETSHADPGGALAAPRLVVKGAAVFGAVTVTNHSRR